MERYRTLNVEMYFYLLPFSQNIYGKYKLVPLKEAYEWGRRSRRVYINHSWGHLCV